MFTKIQWWCFCLVLLAISGAAHANSAIVAITSPSADVTLSFVQPGRIANVQIKEGDLVKVDQALVKLDDAAEQAQLAQVEAQSKDTTQIEASEASLAQKKIDLKRLEWAASRKAATDLEVEHAKLDVKIAELSLKVAQFEHAQNQRKYTEAKIRVDNMTLKSPIIGRVEKVEIENGESVNGLEDVVRIVRIDPLWIDVHVPLYEGKTLKPGQTAQIKFPDGDPLTTQGEIIYVSTVADAASTTLRIRIELSNELNRPAGEHVEVQF